MLARCFHRRQILELGIPILDVLLVRPVGNQKGNVIGTTNPAGWNHLHTFAPGSGEAVIAIDDVETSRRDFGQYDRARQVCVTDSFFIQVRAAEFGKVIYQDTLDAESLRASVDKPQEPSDVELKNPVRVVLITRLDKAGLKFLVSFEPGRLMGFVG